MACVAESLIDPAGRFALYLGDAAEVMEGLPDESVDLFIYSPPFAGLWEYSSDERDLSNCRDYAEFLSCYEFFVKQSARLLKPGCVAAVHCMDAPLDGANLCGYVDFSGDVIRLHQRNGFEYRPRITIWKEPLAVRNRTMMKSLAHRQVVDDSSLVTVAGPDYLIPFRKPGVRAVAITHPNGLMSYAGKTQVPADRLKFRGWEGDQKKNLYSHWIWRRYASSIWDDVRLGRVLPYEESKDPEDERHVHPLQLDVIERAVVLWSNPGETVLTPFMGVGSEVAGAVMNGRRGVGIELKRAYYVQAVKNIQWACQAKPEDQLTMQFDEAAEVTAGAEG